MSLEEKKSTVEDQNMENTEYDSCDSCSSSDEEEISDELAEKEHFVSVLLAFLSFSLRGKQWIEQKLSKKPGKIGALPPEHIKLLREHTNFFQRMERLGQVIDINEDVIRAMCEKTWNSLLRDPMPTSYKVDMARCWSELEAINNCLHSEARHNSLEFDYSDRVRSTLCQIVRDWSVEGEKERDCCYGLFYSALEEEWPDTSKRSEIRILNPGSGLGRIVFDIARMGFICQGCEFSSFMLIASDYILNCTTKANEIVFYPFVQSETNLRDVNGMLRPVSFPDICPSSFEPTTRFFCTSPQMSMCAGDFLEIYKSPANDGAWNAIVTPFFIDTSKDVMDYIETINRLLVPGGLWINFGPLVWHFADSEEQSVELTWRDELRPLIEAMGFVILSEKEVDTTYASNSQSLLMSGYHAIFFIARKK